MPTLNQAILEFLAVERAPTTNTQYRQMLTHLAAFLGAGYDLAAITPGQVVTYVATLRQHISRQSGQLLKDSTIKHHGQVVKALFSWCVEAGYITSSPARKLIIRQLSPAPGDSKAIPPDELAAVIEAARLLSPRNYAMLLLLADTGCRVGGLCSLSIDRLDLPGRSAIILEKGSRWQAVQFGDTTAAALAAWLQVRPAADHAYVWTGKGPAFHPLKPHAVAALLAALCQRTGASRLYSPHSIRHAVGHALAKQGLPVSVVQAKLGHSDPTVTMRAYYPRDAAYLRQVSDQYALAAVGSSRPVPPSKGAKIISLWDDD